MNSSSTSSSGTRARTIASISDPNADTKKLSYFAGVLAKYGIKLPSNLLREVAVDAFCRVGNRYVQHFENGRMVEPFLN